MSRHFSQEKLNGQDYKLAMIEVQKSLQEAALAAITLVLLLGSRSYRQLGREKGKLRRVSRGWSPIC